MTVQLGTLDGLRICTQETDYFQFSGSGDFRLTIDSGDGDADLDVAIYDTEENYVAGSSSAEGSFDVEFSLRDQFDSTQTVLIHVYAVGGQTERNYSLTLATQ